MLCLWTGNQISVCWWYTVSLTPIFQPTHERSHPGPRYSRRLVFRLRYCVSVTVSLYSLYKTVGHNTMSRLASRSILQPAPRYFREPMFRVITYVSGNFSRCLPDIMEVRFPPTAGPRQPHLGVDQRVLQPALRYLRESSLILYSLASETFVHCLQIFME